MGVSDGEGMAVLYEARLEWAGLWLMGRNCWRMGAAWLSKSLLDSLSGVYNRVSGILVHEQLWIGVCCRCSRRDVSSASQGCIRSEPAKERA